MLPAQIGATKTKQGASPGANAIRRVDWRRKSVNDRAVIRLRIGYSVLTLVVALVLAAWFVVPSGGANGDAVGFVGPATWPRAMLIGIALCSAILTVRNALLYASARRVRTPAAHPSDEQFDNRKAAIGIAAVTLYVVATPVIGFALATVAFFLVWLRFGGMRKPHVLASVAIIGTIALLYAFVKLTTLPLERGVGVFDDITVSIYRVLGIY